MLSSLRLLSLTLACFAGTFFPVQAQSPLPATIVSHALPFVLEETDDVSASFPGAPKLQSFAWAQWNGKWVFVGGRTTGYHGVGAAAADFPRSGDNVNIWVVDTSGPGPARTFSLPVACLPDSLASVKDQWQSSNALFFQDNEILYLGGGYGQNSAGEWVTYPILSSVGLPALIQGVMKGQDTFSKTIAWVETPLMQSAGGHLLKLDDGTFYVIGGHIFMGTYRGFEGSGEKNTKAASQKYLGEIRKVRIDRTRLGQLAVSLISSYQDPEFARRDMNSAFTILPDGHSLGAAVYGGVFTRDQLNFSKPIYWSSAAPPKVESGFEQKMSAYSCANLLLFDPDNGSMYSTFFGGISRWTWNDKEKQFVEAPLVGDKTKPIYMDGMPWIDQVSTLVRGPKDAYEIVQPSRLPAYLGADAAFLPVEGLRRIREDANVYDVRPLKGRRTLIGYLYGGIRASPKEFPYRNDSPSYNAGNVPTRSSDLIVAVYITVP